MLHNPLSTKKQHEIVKTKKLLLFASVSFLGGFNLLHLTHGISDLSSEFFAPSSEKERNQWEKLRFLPLSYEVIAITECFHPSFRSA